MKYIHLFIAFFLLLGCETDPLSSDEAVAVRLIPSLGNSAPAGTRVVDQDWKPDTDIVGVSISTAPNDYKQHTPTASGTDFILTPKTDQTLYYPADDSYVTFRAFCPYPTVPANLVGSIVTYKDFEDQSESLKMQAVDLVYHRTDPLDYNKYKKSSGEAVKMEFEHRFSKVVITAKRGTGLTADLTNLKMTLTGMPTQVSFDLSTGVLGTASGSGPINPEHYSKAADKTIARAIIAPHTTIAGQTITFTTPAGLNYSHTIEPDFKFEEKKAYTFEFTLTQTGVVLENATIKNWEGINDDLVIWDNEKNWLTATPTEMTYYKEGRDDNTIVIRTNHPAKPGIRYSKLAESYNGEPQIDWLSAPTDDKFEQTKITSPYEWTFTYDVEANPEIIRRIGYIQFSIGSMTVSTRVVQSTISKIP